MNWNILPNHPAASPPACPKEEPGQEGSGLEEFLLLEVKTSRLLPGLLHISEHGKRENLHNFCFHLNLNRTLINVPFKRKYLVIVFF